MENSMKNRIVELILQAETEADKQNFYNCFISRAKAERITDYLLANNVIAPPCKAGDTVYKINTIPKSKIEPFITKETVEPFAVVYRNIMGGYSCIPFEEFGKTAFLAQDKAEAKLKSFNAYDVSGMFMNCETLEPLPETSEAKE